MPTDPTRADTDRDGISDYDELSEQQFTLLARFNGLFPNYAIDGTDSKKYGTDPLRQDTDGDGITDLDELTQGWAVVRSDGTVVQVFSDPTKADTDSDGLSDDQEREAITDPREPDTDGDGRTDYQEVTVHSNPLLPDILVSVAYSYMYATGHYDGDYNLADWYWKFYVQQSSKPFPGSVLSHANNGCRKMPGSLGNFVSDPGCGTCGTTGRDFNLSSSSAATQMFSLGPGDGLLLHGFIFDHNACPAKDGFHEINCYFSFMDQPLRYEDLQEKSFMMRSFSFNGDGCDVRIFAEIQINCAGTARHICQFGSPCIYNDDCTSGECTKGRCAANCGNGMQEGTETCDDGNNDGCGTCGLNCTGPGTGATCEIHTGCVSDDDCKSGSCFGGECIAVCGNGIKETPDEVCDDGNASSCGTCDALCTAVVAGEACPIGTGCATNADCVRNSCSGGVCVPVCGDRIVDQGSGADGVPYETCDDGNKLDCGTCNKDCNGEGGGTAVLSGRGALRAPTAPAASARTTSASRRRRP